MRAGRNASFRTHLKTVARTQLARRDGFRAAVRAVGSREASHPYVKLESTQMPREIRVPPRLSYFCGRPPRRSHRAFVYLAPARAGIYHFERGSFIAIVPGPELRPMPRGD